MKSDPVQIEARPEVRQAHGSSLDSGSSSSSSRGDLLLFTYAVAAFGVRMLVKSGAAPVLILTQEKSEILPVVKP